MLKIVDPVVLVLSLVVCAASYLLFPKQFSGLRRLKSLIPRRFRSLYEATAFTRPPVRRSQDPTNSGRFQKLPAEIRLLIYKHALGNRLIHLVQGDRLRRRTCYLDNNVDGWYHHCWALGVHAKRYLINPEEEAYPDQLSPLLLTCRHIYSEAVDLLYSSNDFHFLRPADFLYFVNRVGPAKSEQIRSIKLYVNPCPSGTMMTYAAFWSTIRTLPLLRELRILIAPSIMTKEAWKKNEPELLEPIKNFDKHLDVFDVFLAVFPDWTEKRYLNTCHLRSIKEEMVQLSGAHLSRYS